jgi:hypothetical protein
MGITIMQILGSALTSHKHFEREGKMKGLTP